MNHEIESPRELRFVCLECGTNSRGAYSSESLETDYVYEDGGITWD